MLKLTYDTEPPRVAYLKLLNHVRYPIVRTVKIGEDDTVTADLDADGRVVGIEVVGWDGQVEVETPKDAQ